MRFQGPASPTLGRVLILLPPSEGKTAPRRGKQLDLHSLSFPALGEPRAAVLAALLDLCPSGNGSTPLHDEIRVEQAARTLGLGPTQTSLVLGNGRLMTAPTARADRVYSGVLYDALSLATLDAAARRRATRWLGIQSALFGLVRPSDHIPAYRLSGDVSLPGIGVVSSRWREAMDPVVREAAGNGLVIDLRSGMYASFWKPTIPVATVRVLHEVNGQRKVVSHFNKATKGRIVRDLLTEGATVKTPLQLAELLGDLGWTVEPQAAKKSGQQLDVVVAEL